MKKAKNTTLDERLKIVTDCLANDKNYGAMALKYDCSYQQVRNWVIRYEKMGQAGVIRQIKRCLFRQIKTGLSEHLTIG